MIEAVLALLLLLLLLLPVTAAVLIAAATVAAGTGAEVVVEVDVMLAVTTHCSTTAVIATSSNLTCALCTCMYNTNSIHTTNTC
jgi:hypothetical protein